MKGGDCWKKKDRMRVTETMAEAITMTGEDQLLSR